jgi:peptidoglycan/xylan/chitin deacetylase (PgdA/CDA1 family)
VRTGKTTDAINVCFHGVGTPQRDLEPGEDGYWVSQDSFERILDDVLTWPVRVNLSFDDGNASDAEIALPALRERGLPAQFFVLAGRFGNRGSLAADDVRELATAGMGIGTHGMAHRPWRHLSEADRHAEFVAARDTISVAAGKPVDEAACPLGRYDRRVLSTLKRLGYTRVHTSDRRRADAAAWLQPRYSVRSGDDVASLREDVLRRPSAPRATRLTAVGLLKRWR